MNDAIISRLDPAPRGGDERHVLGTGIRALSDSLAAAAGRIELVEDGVGRAPLADLLGYLSSVQEAAAAIGLDAVHLISRQMEALLDSVMADGGVFSRTALDTISRGVDVMTLLVRDLERQQGGHSPAALDEAVDRLLEDVARVSAPAGSPPPRLRLVRRRNPAVQPLAALERTLDQVCDVGRYTSRRLGKDIIVETAGGELRVPVRLAEAVVRPLEQLIRSSVDHGIEPRAARAAMGKHPTGRIDVTASLESGHLVLEIADDGASLECAGIPLLVESDNLEGGSNPREVDATAHKARLGALSARELIMALVRGTIDDLGGSMQVVSESAPGTRIVLRLPLSLKERRRS